MDSSKENGWNSRTRFPLQNWNRYQYEGLNLLRIDERWDANENPPQSPLSSGEAIHEQPPLPRGEQRGDHDPWRPINTFVHGPGQISQVVRGTMHHTLTPALSLEGEGDLEVTHHEMTYVYDAVGNVRGALLDCVYYPFEMGAFGNRIEGTPEWPSMTAPGPKDRLTGKMYDDTVGLYYFHARWYDPGVGRFVSRDPVRSEPPYEFVRSNPLLGVDPTGACYAGAGIPIESHDHSRAWVFTGGLPEGWYKAKASAFSTPGKREMEEEPCCSESEARAEWDTIVADVKESYGGYFFACASNKCLVDKVKRQRKCWACDLQQGKKASWNPMLVFWGMKGHHQWGECKLKIDTEERPWGDSRNPLLDNWWGSSVTHGMSGHDMRLLWPLPGEGVND